jgi:integrase
MNNPDVNSIEKFDIENKEYFILWNKVDKNIKLLIPESFNKFAAIPDFVIRYLINIEPETPWIQSLILYAMILNKEIPSPKLYNNIGVVNSLLNWARQLNYTVNSNLDIKKVFLSIKRNSKIIYPYLGAYNCFLKSSNVFFDNNNDINKEDLANYLLPEFKSDIQDLYKIEKLERKTASEQRRNQVEPIKKEIANLVSLARVRWEWMHELFKKINKIKPLIKSGAIQLPYDIEMPSFDQMSILNFRIWNKAAWVNAHKSKYSKSAITYRCTPNERNSEEIFFQLIGEIPANSWFLQALHNKFLQSGHQRSSSADNYAKMYNMPRNHFISGNNRNIFNADHSMAIFFFHAKKKIENAPSESDILFQAEPLISASLIGFIAILLIAMTGMRINEIQQLHLESSIKLIFLPKYNELEALWEDQGTLTYIFETFTKGKTELQKTYVPKIIIEALNMYSKVYFDFHNEKIKPIICSTVWKNFECSSFLRDNIKTWIFQWSGIFFSKKTTHQRLQFAVLEHNIIDQNGKAVRISSHVFRHGFAGYLRSKGVPLDRIATLLHHVNLQVTDYYSQEPDEVNIEELLPILNEIGDELQIDPGMIRDIEDIRRFEQECLKKFGVLRKVIGGHCGSYCSCEVMNMCARCEHYIPDPDKLHEIAFQITCNEKGAECFQKSGQFIQAERARMEANDWRIQYAEAEKWGKVLKLEGTSFDEFIEGWKLKYVDDPRIQPKILPCLPLKKNDEPAPENKNDAE